MPYVRISIATPNAGQGATVEKLMKRINKNVASQDGCLSTYLMKSTDGTGELARMAIYRDEQSAEKAATNDSLMALRSELHQVIKAGHLEKAFQTEE